MKVEFTDMQELENPLNAEFFSDSQELEAPLDQLRHRKPFGFELVGENGFTLTVCLSATRGSAQYAASNNDPPYLLAVAAGSPSTEGINGKSAYYRACKADEAKGMQSPEFLVGATATPVPTRYCLPFTLVKKVADHFLRTGGREPSVISEQKLETENFQHVAN